MKQLWIFNQYAITPEQYGGTRHFDLATTLFHFGYKTTIFASSFNHVSHRETRTYASGSHLVEDIFGIRFVWLKTLSYEKKYLRRLASMLDYSIKALRCSRLEELGNPDIVIGSSVHLFAVYIAKLVAMRFGVPFLMEVRDLMPKTLIDMGISKYHPYVMLMGVLEKHLYQKAIRIITLLPDSGEYIASLGIPPEKVIWISNGVDLKRFDENVRRSGNTQGKKPGTFMILHAGSMSMANNLIVALDAAAILSKANHLINFVFVGGGVDRHELEAYVRAKNLVNVTFRDLVSKNEVPGLLADADALLILFKGLGLYKYGVSANKLFDYLAAGKPILYSASLKKNIVEEAGAGITAPPDDPQALADAVLRLYHMSAWERERLGSNGRAYVEKYYSMEVLGESFKSVLESELQANKKY